MTERLMTRGTLEGLQTKKEDLERQIRELGSGSSGHQRASLHDDAGTEYQLNLARGVLSNIGDLSGVEVIPPRKETDNVGLGNSVRLQFVDGEEIVCLLGRDDAIYRKDLGTITSVNSPLGMAVLGKKTGDIVRVQTNPKTFFEVKIIEICPSDFQ